MARAVTRTEIADLLRKVVQELGRSTGLNADLAVEIDRTLDEFEQS